MKAVAITKYGDESAVQILILPKVNIKPNEVLVEVYSAGLNPIDVKIRKGEMKPLLNFKLPLVLGTDFSGKVVEVGPEIKKFKVGDEVYGSFSTSKMGAFAEYVAVSETDLSLKPKKLSFDEAASIPLVGLTVYQALIDFAKIKSGQKVFIQAGSGGIGTFAIQFAKALGAIVATTTSEKNVEWVKNLGADHVINYNKENYNQVLKNYDVFLNSVDGEPIERGLDILKPGGHLLSVVGPPDKKFAKQAKLNFFFQVIMTFIGLKINRLSKNKGVDYNFVFVAPSGSQLNEIKKMIEDGKISPVIDKVFPFGEAKEAMAYIAQGRTKGKVVLKIK